MILQVPLRMPLGVIYKVKQWNFTESLYSTLLVWILHYFMNKKQKGYVSKGGGRR
jgi:hypothetical protein